MNSGVFFLGDRKKCLNFALKQQVFEPLSSESVFEKNLWAV